MTINFQNLDFLNKNIEKSAELLIVTKNQTAQDICTLLSSGYANFGENRVQEAKTKFMPLRDKFNFNLHLIGNLQRNKIKEALKIFDVIQTIDRTSLIDEISKELASANHYKTKKFFIQVNIGNEKQKSGVADNDLINLYNYALSKNINIEGLMCIPPNISDPSKYFNKMCLLRNEIDKNLKLSMGMSSDYVIALKHQSNMVRIGSMIFK